MIRRNVILQVHWQIKLVHGIWNVQRNRSFRRWWVALPFYQETVSFRMSRVCFRTTYRRGPNDSGQARAVAFAPEFHPCLVPFQEIWGQQRWEDRFVHGASPHRKRGHSARSKIFWDTPFFSAVYQVSKPAYGTAPSHRCRLQNLLLLAPFSRRDKPISHPYKQSAAKDVPQRDRHHVADPSTNGNGLGMPR